MQRPGCQAILLAVGFDRIFLCLYPVYEERQGVQLILPVTSVSTEEGVFKNRRPRPE